MPSSGNLKRAINHPWNVSVAEARDIQNRLSPLVVTQGRLPKVRYVAGVDVSVKNNRSVAAFVVLRYADLQIADVATSDQTTPFPYIPGLLSFREIPAIISAFEKLQVKPDLILVDGQGLAHPRRFGLASHLGILLDIPTIGCAKTRFIGTHEEPAAEAGCYTDLWDGEELIGAVLRTRENVKPLYISTGHKIGLPPALDRVLECCIGYRLPEPTRLAHQAAGGNLKRLPSH